VNALWFSLPTCSSRSTPARLLVDDEFVPIDELVDSAAILALTLIDHCGTS
jgi:hypothetical protein